MTLTIGSPVRVVTAPDKLGEIVADAGIRSGKQRWLVEFRDKSRQQLPERNLELVCQNDSEQSKSKQQRFGSAHSLRKLITHARISGKLNDVLYSMETSNTEFLAYQYKPVLNFLSSSSSGLLIADEVGLGKTIEAGLIWTEIRTRYDLSRLLVVCPPHLQIKWQDELLEKFGIQAEIVGSEELLQKLRSAKSKTLHEFALIASLNAISPPKTWRRFRENESDGKASAKLAEFLETVSLTEQVLDCTIIDEAHYLRNSNTYNTLGHLLRAASKYLLLLSATPIQVRDRDLFNILNILDPVNFDSPKVFAEVLEANAPLIRLSDELRRSIISQQDFQERISDCLRHRFTKHSRLLKTLSEDKNIDLTNEQTRIRIANQLERTNLLGSVISRSRKKDVLKNRRVVRSVNAIVITPSAIEKKVYEAVTKAVRHYCEGSSAFEGFQLTTPQKQLCSSMPGAYRHWADRSTSSTVDEPMRSNSDLHFLETFFQNTDADLDLDTPLTSPENKSQSELIQYIRDNVLKDITLADLEKNDSKFDQLRELIESYWNTYPNEKIVLFAFYRETLTYLNQRLAGLGINSVLLMGNKSKEDKDLLLKEFKKPDGAKILLSSEVLCEGVDLQFCGALINYDLPWNPMKVEQRIGRIDRIGQKREKILIWNFFYKDTIDDRVYTRLFERLNVFQKSLGDIELVLGDQISSLTNTLLTHDLDTQTEIKAINDAAENIEQTAQQKEVSERENDGLVIHGDFVEQKANSARRLKRYIDGKILWTYVRDFLLENYPGTTFVEKSASPLIIQISLSKSARDDLRRAIEQNNNFRPTRLVNSDLSAGTICVFDNKADYASKQQEIINVTHSLVKFASAKIDKETFYDLTAVEISALSLDLTTGIYAFITQLWEANGAKSYDRLMTRAINLDNGHLLNEEEAELLLNASINDGDDWGNVRANVDPDSFSLAQQKLSEILELEFDEYARLLTEENLDQLQFLQSGINQRIEAELSSLNEVLRNYEQRRNERMIKLTSGRITSVENRLIERTSEIAAQSEMKIEAKNLISGVIRVY